MYVFAVSQLYTLHDICKNAFSSSIFNLVTLEYIEDLSFLYEYILLNFFLSTSSVPISLLTVSSTKIIF